METFLAWLKTIAYNHLIDHWRARRRHASIESDLSEQLVADSGQRWHLRSRAAAG